MRNILILNILSIINIENLTRMCWNMKWSKLEKKIINGILVIIILNVLVLSEWVVNIQRIKLGWIDVSNVFNMMYIGYDSISLIFVILTLVIGIVSILSNYDNILYNKVLYNNRLWILILALSLNFMCLDLLNFYILFEITLIPLYYIIGIEGSKKKERASLYMFIYTLGSSLFMLLGIILIWIVTKSLDYNLLSKSIISKELGIIIFIGLVLGLSIKTPLVPIHVWLPTVHSESSLGGSVLLAGVILKLSIYGIIRLLLNNIPEIVLLEVSIFYIIGIITIIYSSLITLMQIDLKGIIAYSSISHLGICIIGILSNNVIGVIGSLVLCLAHGLVSPGLFILMGGVLYDRFHNRGLYYYQGLTQYMPYFGIYLLLFSFSNTGTPLSYNFIGEFLSITGGIIKYPLIGSMAVISVLLSACYQMKLTNKLTSGVYSIYLKITNDLIYKENFLLFILICPTILFGIVPNIIHNVFILNSSGLIYNIITIGTV